MNMEPKANFRDENLMIKGEKKSGNHINMYTSLPGECASSKMSATMREKKAEIILVGKLNIKHGWVDMRNKACLL